MSIIVPLHHPESINMYSEPICAPWESQKGLIYKKKV